jgi:dephospho-CoA kinase
VPAVLSTDGRLNKEPLFAAMLADPALRKDLEHLLSPLLLRRVRDYVKDLTGPGALDAALLFEAELDGFCDATLCVTCPRQERQRRVLARTGASAKHFGALDAAQWSEEKKLLRAHASLSTEGPESQLQAKLLSALSSLGLRS